MSNKQRSYAIYALISDYLNGSVYDHEKVRVLIEQALNLAERRGRVAGLKEGARFISDECRNMARSAAIDSIASCLRQAAEELEKS